MASKAREAVPQKMDGFWYLSRRVPLAFKSVDARRLVRMSTGIRVADDPRGVTARKVVARLDAELRQHWLELAGGKNPNEAKNYKAAARTAELHGFKYMEAEKLLAGPLLAVVERLEALGKLPEEGRRKASPGLLGGVKKPGAGLRLSDMLAAFEKIKAGELCNKSVEQRRKWQIGRETCLKDFIRIVGGDRLMSELTWEMVETYRQHWQTRVEAGEVEVGTANKDIGRMAAMYRAIGDFHRLRLDDVFAHMRLAGEVDNTREAFDIEHVQDVLLADGALAGLNPEARAIFYVVAETGMRPSEVTGLVEEAICLDHRIPHVQLKEVGRKLKTQSSIRDVPLLGVALEVMKHFSKGFPRYRDRNAALSATVNKFLKENGLVQREGQSFYSLRHTFRDRLRDAKIGDELSEMMMGHARGEEKYGRGYLLDAKQEALKKIVFRAPGVLFD